MPDRARRRSRRSAPCPSRRECRAHRSAGTARRRGRAMRRTSCWPSAIPGRKCAVPRREVGMVQVIGLDAHRDETAEQGLEHRRIVVDAAQQHALRQYRDAGAHQPAHRRPHRRRSARAGGWRGPRHTPPFRPPAPRPARPPTRPGIGHRHARVKTDHRDMRDRVERAHDRRDAARRQQKRVAAGDDHLPDFGMLSRYRRRRGRAPPGASTPSPWPDLLAAEAEAAIDRADQDRLQQDPVGVAVDDAGQRRPALVADRVGPVVGRGRPARRRSARIAPRSGRRIGRIDQRRHVVGDRDRELLRHPAQFPARSGATRPEATRSSNPKCQLTVAPWPMLQSPCAADSIRGTPTRPARPPRPVAHPPPRRPDIRACMHTLSIYVSRPKAQETI